MFTEEQSLYAATKILILKDWIKISSHSKNEAAIEKLM